MKKTLTLLAFLLIALSNAYADQVTFDFDTDYAKFFPTLAGTSSNESHDGDITTDMTTPAIGGVTVTVSAKTSGNNENRIWSSSPRLRLYSGTLTVESSGSPITYIKFTTGSNFNIASVDAGTLSNKEWTGSANKIVFSIAKNTQIKQMEVTAGGTAPVIKKSLYGINFTKDQTGWSVLNKNLPEALTYIWTANSYGYVASAFYNEASYESEAWLISPVMNMTGASEVELIINHAGNKFAGKVEDQVSVLATTDGTNWAPLKVAQWPAGNSWTFNESAVDIASLAGKDKVQIAFKYTSTAQSSGTYEISEFTIKGNGTITTDDSFTGVQAPVISFDEASKTVTITDPSGNNNSIFYTLDGTNPDDSKLFYEAPFTINATTTVKAICYDDLDQASAITTKVCSVAGEALKTCADLVANCTTTEGVNITFEFTDLLVTSASGQYVFVKDNTAPFLFFKNSSYKRGDKLTGSVSGKLYLYNGVMELSVNDWNNVTVASSGNEVTPEKVAVTDVTPAIQSKYIRIEGLKYARTDGSYFYFTDGTNELTVYDKFKLMSGVAISESNTYNINGVATVYKETPQVYVFDVKDVEVISTKADPQTTIEKSELKALLAEEKVNIKYETKSDARLFWASTNPNVATVEDGVVTLLGTGFTEITLETEENETYQASKATMKLYVFSGADATENNPYDAGDVQAAMLYEKADTIADVWVKGYLVGFANGSLGKAVFGTEGAVLSNILIAKNPNETDVNNCIPVALESKPAAAKTIREELNLVDHPENLGKEIILNGSIIAYFSVPGMKSLKAYKFAEGGKKGDADEDGEVTVSDITTIASYILGNNPQPFNFNNADVDGDSAITVSDITGTASIILGTN